ncbi:MAG: NHL repeat-containing protein [bacterium]
MSILRIYLSWLLVSVLALAAGSSCHRAGRVRAERFQADSLPSAVVVEQVIDARSLGVALLAPFGLAGGADGSFYVTDSETDRLLHLDRSGRLLGQVGGSGFGSNLLNQPTFVTVDNFLNLIVADQGNRRLVRFDLGLNYVEDISFDDDDPERRMQTPSGVAISEYGELWVADRGNDRIAVMDNTAVFDRFVGDFGYSGGQLSQPEKILWDHSGNLLVCDAGNGRLVRYDAYGNHQSDVDIDGLEYPIAAAGRRGQLWVLDGAGGRLACVEVDGAVVLQVGPALIGETQPLRQPSDITFLSDGRLVISDTGNSRLLVCKIIRESR